MASIELSDDNTGDVKSSLRKPFRFKQQGKPEGNDNRDYSKEESKQSSHHHSHRRHKRRKRSHEADTPDETYNNAGLAPDIAFRESLFDAMGDDEGAAFWQGVYGQPIHTYPKSYRDPDTGLVEAMDDEQYAKYVRQKMWEKSAEGINVARESKRRKRREEDARRDRERQQEEPGQSEGTQTGPYNNFPFDFEIEASLRRGQRRKNDKRWQEIWRTYQDKWRKLQEMSEAQKGTQANINEQVFLDKYLAWPVESGNLKDISAEEIDRFVQRISTLQNDPSTTTAAFLKGERIRWHPDKIQQRYGFMHIDEATMAGVTATFQIFDNMWNEQRVRHM